MLTGNSIRVGYAFRHASAELMISFSDFWEGKLGLNVAHDVQKKRRYSFGIWANFWDVREGR